jgi:hypothetical protein
MWTVGCGPESQRSETTIMTSTTGAVAIPQCGEPLDWVATGTPLAMTARFPDGASTGGDGLLRGTITVTNHSRTALAGTTAAQPDLVLLRDGLVVSLPVGVRAVALIIDLQPGASREFDAVASLRSCDSGPYPEGAPLGPGTYQMIASQQFEVAEPGSAGSRPVLAQGGPWDITLS